MLNVFTIGKGLFLQALSNLFPIVISQVMNVNGSTGPAGRQRLPLLCADYGQSDGKSGKWKRPLSRQPKSSIPATIGPQLNFNCRDGLSAEVLLIPCKY